MPLRRQKRDTLKTQGVLKHGLEVLYCRRCNGPLGREFLACEQPGILLAE